MSQNQFTILIADEIHPSLFLLLDEMRVIYTYRPEITRKELITELSNYKGLIIRSKTTIDEELLTNANQLRWIGRAGAGLDQIDSILTEQRGIQVVHASEGNRDAVAEHTMGMLLGLLANINKADREIRQGIWDREGNRGYELGNLTVGLIGFGNNGRATAQRLSGFGCRVLGYDKYLIHYGGAYAQEAKLEEIQEEADIISLHVPLTDETQMMVNSLFIERVKKPFYLINIARGNLISLTALVHGLQTGKVRGACLDVLENENLTRLTPEQQAAFTYLRRSERVILTPHIAGWTHESYVRINNVLVKQLSEFLL